MPKMNVRCPLGCANLYGFCDFLKLYLFSLEHELVPEFSIAGSHGQPAAALSQPELMPRLAAGSRSSSAPGE